MTASDKPARPGRRRWIARLLGLAIVVGLVVVLARAGDPRRYAELMKEAEPRWWLPVIALQVGTYFAAGAIYTRVLRRTGAAPPIGDMTALGLAKQFTDQTVPTGGLGGSVVVVKGLERRGYETPIAAAAVLVDLIAHYVVFAALLVLALVLLGVDHSLGMIVIAASVGFLVIAVAVPGFVLWVNGRDVDRMPRLVRRLRPLRRAAAAVAEAPAGLVRDRALLTEVGLLEAVVFVLDVGTFAMILAAIGATVPLSSTFAAYTIAYLASTVGIVPGGLGTFEAASVAMLSLLGIGIEASITATLLFRLVTYWAPLLPGAVLARREVAA